MKTYLSLSLLTNPTVERDSMVLDSAGPITTEKMLEKLDELYFGLDVKPEYPGVKVVVTRGNKATIYTRRGGSPEKGHSGLWKKVCTTDVV